MNEHKLIRIYTENHVRMVRYCRSLLMHDPKYLPQAEEIVQETYITAWEMREKLAEHPNIVGWMMATCRHKCQSIVRRDLNRRDILGTQVEYDEAITVAQQQDAILRWLNALEAREQLAELQKQFTPLEQDVFDAYFRDGSSMKETALRLGRKLDAVNDAIRRIRKKALRMDWSLLLTTGPAAFALLCRILGEGRRM